MSSIHEYLNKLKSGYKQYPSSIETSTVSSIDTEELLSDTSSENSSRVFSKSHRRDVKSYALTEKYKRPSSASKPKRRHQSTTGVAPLNIIKEVDENFEHSRLGYNLDDYLPKKSKLDLSVYLPKPYKASLNSSMISNYDSQNLLDSSDEEPATKKSKGRVPFTPRLTINQTVQTSIQNFSPKSSTSKWSSGKKDYSAAVQTSFQSNSSHQSEVSKSIREKRWDEVQTSFQSFSSQSAVSKYSLGAKEWEDVSEAKDSFYNPMISINSDNNKTSRSQSRDTSPTPTTQNPGHARRSTADFNYPFSISPDPAFKRKIPAPLQMPSHPFSKTTTLISDKEDKIRIVDSSREKESLEMTLQPHHKEIRCSLSSARNTSITPKFKKDANCSMPFTSDESVENSIVVSSRNAINLNICTCILNGSLYRHYENCQKFSVTAIISGSNETKCCCNRKKMGVLEACITIQRAVRDYLDRLNFYSSFQPTDREF
ncbi:unnamed protein product [Blepharisma stoltei]|uniref:Uncharacterized protein n=1 Tax=Blepharisma stoltei TaxID=1481888 RepID=A0AAU9J844_9CILI|nr:unnamed protein product [Blepharisma stoltei]